MVLEQAPLVAVEVVDAFDQSGVIESVVAEEMSHMRPVFLFDVGVVVFLVGACSGEVDFSGFMLAEVANEVVVEELRAVVTVEALQFKGQASLDVLDLLDDSGGAVVPHGATFGPAGVDIGERQAPDEVTGQRVAAMGDGIGFHEAGLRDVPVVCADGDLISQEAAGLRSTEASGASLGTCWGQQPVKSGGTDR